MDNSLKEIYEQIYNDQSIRKIYDDIEKREIINKEQAFHNFEHITNVTNMVKKILSELNVDEEIIYKAEIASILHDVGAIEGKENHAYRSYEFAKKYFNDKKINFAGIDLVTEAIKIHSDGFETDNIIALALILSDKLDVKKNRISEEGKKYKGNRQYAHIENIIVNVKDKMLQIEFVTDGNMDIKEVNEYYFTKKIFKSLNAFSKKMGVEYTVLLDNREWKI